MKTVRDELAEVHKEVDELAKRLARLRPELGRGGMDAMQVHDVSSVLDSASCNLFALAAFLTMIAEDPTW